MKILERLGVTLLVSLLFLTTFGLSITLIIPLMYWILTGNSWSDYVNFIINLCETLIQNSYNNKN